MKQHVKKVMIGTAMVGVLATGAVTGGGVLAVEGTPTNGNAGMVDDHAAERASEYATFITLLAGNLGVDAETADAEMRQTLLGLVDQAIVDGVITQEQGNQVRTEISSAEFSPNVRGLLRGAGPLGHRERDRDRHGHDGRGRGEMNGHDREGNASTSEHDGAPGETDDDGTEVSTPLTEGSSVSG